MKSDQPYLRHIQDAIEKIESYASMGRDIFMTVSHWQDAIIRQLEIIGEATKRLSATCVPGIRRFLGVALRGFGMC